MRMEEVYVKIFIVNCECAQERKTFILKLMDFSQMRVYNGVMAVDVCIDGADGWEYWIVIKS